MSCLVLPSFALYKAPARPGPQPVVAASDVPEPAVPRGTVTVSVPSPAVTHTPQPVATHSQPLAASRSREVGYPINVAIADCESGDRLKNGRARHYSYDIRQQNSGSSASGKYQFIRSTWHSVTGLPGNAADYSESIQDSAFWKLWANGAGAHHWYPSRSCWA